MENKQILKTSCVAPVENIELEVINSPSDSLIPKSPDSNDMFKAELIHGNVPTAINANQENNGEDNHNQISLFLYILLVIIPIGFSIYTAMLIWRQNRGNKNFSTGFLIFMSAFSFLLYLDIFVAFFSLIGESSYKDVLCLLIVCLVIYYTFAIISWTRTHY